MMMMMMKVMMAIMIIRMKTMKITVIMLAIHCNAIAMASTNLDASTKGRLVANSITYRASSTFDDEID